MIYVTTSNAYAHLLPIFEYLYKKYWGDSDVLVVGYDKPEGLELPFHSMGEQGPVENWSTDLRKFFSEQKHDHFIWVMEDCFFRQPVDERGIVLAWAMSANLLVGRIDLTRDIQSRPHNIDAFGLVAALPSAKYPLSTQPSLWNKTYLLQYLTEGLTPWAFEVQDIKPLEWAVCGLHNPAIVANEGVRKRDIRAVDLGGMKDEDIDAIKKISTWLK